MFETQIFGTCASQNDFELKLRGAGANVIETFDNELEVIFRVPSSSSGGAQSQVKLVGSTPQENDLEEPKYRLQHEIDMPTDKETVIRIVSMDDVLVKGKAVNVLTSIGFKEEFRHSRRGFRTTLPGGWKVDYFSLLDATKLTDSKRARISLEDSKGKDVLLVSIQRSFADMKDVKAQIADGHAIIRRLSPEFQPSAKLSIFGRT